MSLSVLCNSEILLFTFKRCLKARWYLGPFGCICLYCEVALKPLLWLLDYFINCRCVNAGPDRPPSMGTLLSIDCDYKDSLGGGVLARVVS